MKKYYKWIIYYAVVIGLIALAALIFPQAVRLNYYSLAPVAYMALWVLVPIINQYKLNWRAVLQGEETHGLEPEEWKLIFAVLPAFFPFVFFFSRSLKLSSVVIMLIAYFAIIIYSTKAIKKQADAHQAELKKELEEQKKKEELGRWK